VIVSVPGLRRGWGRGDGSLLHLAVRDGALHARDGESKKERHPAGALKRMGKIHDLRSIADFIFTDGGRKA
jgi:hypothetical protein